MKVEGFLCYCFSQVRKLYQNYWFCLLLNCVTVGACTGFHVALVILCVLPAWDRIVVLKRCGQIKNAGKVKKIRVSF